MDIGPLLPGRIPNSLVSDRLLQNLQSSEQAMSKLQQQVSTGKQYTLGSENPAAASQTVSLQQLLDGKTQVETNIQTDKSLLSATDSALASISNLLNTAQQLASSGIGDNSTPAEKQGMATQVQAMIQSALNAANSTFGGRYLFGGSQSGHPPFSLTPEGAVRYNGDQQTLNSYVDLGQLMGTNVDGHAAFGAISPPVGSNVNPALTLQTQVDDLSGGQGVKLGQITVTLVNGPSTQSQTIDLSAAKSIGDIKAIVENAFTPGSLTVSLNGAQNGLQFTPLAGTVTVSDIAGGTTAASLGIASPAAAQIAGSDLNPRLSLTTPLAALNGGTGIGAVAGHGLKIVNGSTTTVVDLSSATTVEDVLNALNAPSLNLSASINAAGTGLAISTRLSGVSFSIGENNGVEATRLGIRTLSASTSLSDLNFGSGAPVNGGQPLQITRRDASVVSVDLSGAATIQDVMNKINAVSPGHLVASLNAVGNGISLTDDSGAAALTVSSAPLSDALGLTGSAPAGQTLAGQDVNPLEVHGTFNVLVDLQRALASQDNAALTRLGGLVTTEQARLTSTQSQLGSRMQSLNDIDNRVQAEQLQIKQSISTNSDADLTSVITQLVNQQTVFQAALKAAAQTMQLNLESYL